MHLPPEVHRVIARGKPYYYWHPGRGTKRADGKPVRLPDAEQNPKEFWIEVERLGGKAEYAPKSLAVMLRDYEASPQFRDDLSEATKRDYARYLKFWTLHLGKYTAEALRASHILHIRDEFLAGKLSTGNHAVAVLSAAFLWGIPRDHSVFNPCEKVPKSKIETEGRRPWPPWALEIAHDHFRPELRRAVALGLYTGQRIGDVLKMRADQIEGDVAGLKLTQSKTGKPLFIPFHDSLRPEIAQALADGHDYLVCRPDGRPFSGQDFQAMWSREMAKEPHGRIKREGFSFHGLRTLAVCVLAETTDALRISAITGQSLNIVERYLKDHRQRELAAQAISAWQKGL